MNTISPSTRHYIIGVFASLGFLATYLPSLQGLLLLILLYNMATLVWLQQWNGRNTEFPLHRFAHFWQGLMLFPVLLLQWYCLLNTLNIHVELFLGALTLIVNTLLLQIPCNSCTESVRQLATQDLRIKRSRLYFLIGAIIASCIISVLSIGSLFSISLLPSAIASMLALPSLLLSGLGLLIYPLFGYFVVSQDSAEEATALNSLFYKTGFLSVLTSLVVSMTTLIGITWPILVSSVLENGLIGLAILLICAQLVVIFGFGYQVCQYRKKLFSPS